MKTQTPHESKTRLLDAAMYVIRAKGYSATTVDDICHKAGVTKGSFFHHFKSKEELALAAAAHFAAMAKSLFGAAPYQLIADPRQRVLGYVDFRAAILQGDLPDYTCLLGTLIQETYETHPALQEACGQHMRDHIADIAIDIAEAKRLYAPGAPWSPESLGRFTQAAIQGAYILAKAEGGPAVAAEAIGHLRRYLEAQLPPAPPSS